MRTNEFHALSDAAIVDASQPDSGDYRGTPILSTAQVFDAVQQLRTVGQPQTPGYCPADD